MDQATESPLNSALRQFELTEANLVKLEKVATELTALIGTGPAFGESPEYESACNNFDQLWDSLPKIDDWKPDISLLSYDAIGQMRLDALEIGEIGCTVSTERAIEEPFRYIREYRRRFNQKRRELVRDSLIKTIDLIDDNLKKLASIYTKDCDVGDQIECPEFNSLRENVAQINALLGSNMRRPKRWSDLHRHLSFGMVGDLLDIINNDWPEVKPGLQSALYSDTEPVPVDADDLGSLVSNKPEGPVITKLRWESITDNEFERLIFSFISAEPGYENPEWLTHTNAPDKGRDLSVTRIHHDPLAGAIRSRVIIQCKHWLSKSVGLSDVSTLKTQMTLWEPPRVDVHVIATTGRFTSDAVAFVEKHNQSDSALRIEMWPEVHIERLLTKRPHLIAEFSLR